MDDDRIAGRFPRPTGSAQNGGRLSGAIRAVIIATKPETQQSLAKKRDKKALFNGQGHGTGNHHIGRHDVQQKPFNFSAEIILFISATAAPFTA